MRGGLSRAGLALGLSLGIGLAGYRRRALSRSGAAGAVLVGGATHLAGGWRWSGILLTFFVSSSALSRLERRSPAGPAIAAMAERGSQRDLVQVMANGGIAAGCAAAFLAVPSPRLAAAFAGAFAAANADTWATEIGGLSRAQPRLITGGRRVPAGTSGGVTAVGLLGAAGGAALIGLVAGALQSDPSARRGGAVALAGLLGSLADSLAGATLQAGYRCPACEQPTEATVHRCGTPTELVRGLAWVSNDVVNVICTAVGAAAALRLAPAAAR